MSMRLKAIETSSSKLDSINIKPGQFIIDSSMSKLYFDASDNRRLEFGVNAQSAINDRLGQQIDTTYIKGISINDHTLTVTRGGGVPKPLLCLIQYILTRLPLDTNIFQQEAKKAKYSDGPAPEAPIGVHFLPISK